MLRGAVARHFSPHLQVGKATVFGLDPFTAASGKGSTLKILAETLQAEWVEYKLSLGARHKQDYVVFEIM